MDTDATRRLVAMNRFGLGARPGGLAALGRDPKAALKAEIARPDVALIDPDTIARLGLASTTPDVQRAFAAEEERRLQRDAAAAKRSDDPGVGSDTVAAASMAPAAPIQPEQAIYRAEAQARFAKAAAADIGFVERLVAFWSNHFCVSVSKSTVLRACAGAYEREAIRPHVLGSFRDMLLAVERHPAMLTYLDNIHSVGPDSAAGQHGKRGLNENLAREIMELHTLGVDGGYGQDDVTALARVLTGWTMAGRDGRLGEPGAFVFNARAHQPGEAVVVGSAYGEEGEGQGEAALTFLARHPATARHIAAKLARHFVADDPPPALVARLTRIFLERDGDLRAMATALVDAPECWSVFRPKLRSPNDLAMATLRLTGAVPDDPAPALGAMRALGMPLWDPPGPNGYTDMEAEWGSAEGMKLRLDLAARAAQRLVKDGHEPQALLEAAMGAAASDETRLAVARAATREQAVALVLMSPEFQRR